MELVFLAAVFGFVGGIEGDLVLPRLRAYNSGFADENFLQSALI